MTESLSPTQKGQNLLSFYRSGKELPNDDFREADIRGSSCPKLKIIYRDLTRLNAQKTVLTNAQLLNCNLHQANFQFSQLNNIDLSFSHLEGARFGGSKGVDINFQQSNLRRANLHQTIFWRANFRLSSLEYADCAGADLRWADLRGCNLKHCNLRGSALIGAIFNEQTIINSGWTDFEKNELVNQGAIWQESTINYSVPAEGIQILSRRNSPPKAPWFFETMALLFDCNVTVLGTENNLFLRLNKTGNAYEMAKEIGQFWNFQEQSVVRGKIHDKQILCIQEWLKEGATITLWEKVKNEIIVVETWTTDDAIEVKE